MIRFDAGRRQGGLIETAERKMLHRADSYDALVADFRWQGLSGFHNIADIVADRWAEREPDRVCLEYFHPDGHHCRWSYGELRAAANRLASGLQAAGISRGERLAILLPQSFETVVAHVAAYKIGAIAVPLALLFGPEALEYRLRHSGARAIVVDGAGLEKLAAVRENLPELRLVIVAGDAKAAAGVRDSLSLESLLAAGSDTFQTARTTASTPALMIFTSGTTGPPKGALHGHGVLAGHLPGIQFAHEFMPRPGDRMWTPADWAWAGGLLNALLPALALGVPVVASRAQKFDGHTAFRILSGMQVRNAFIPPTALRLMKAVEAPARRYDFRLRSVSSAGEPLGRDTFEWARRELGVSVNELYGQTECNAVIASCAALGVSRPPAIGKPVPGHRVAVLDRFGSPAPVGEAGEIAIERPDPVMFLGYWEDEAATTARFSGDWLLTGDQAVVDEDGYIGFVGREDDIITSSGFRIGPGEIEDCIAAHPSVAMVAVVGRPDPVRTEIVKAFVVLRDGVEASDELAREIAGQVRSRLSAHEYPREVEFVADLPMTTTGKIVRRELRARTSHGPEEG